MHLIFGDNKARGLIDTIFSIGVILVISGIFAGIWLVHLREAREVALQNQLTNLKHSLELYMIVEGHYPEDLRALNERCRLSIEDSIYSRKYLEYIATDKEGYPVDPFGRRFIYDSKTGRIGKEEAGR